MGNTQHIAAIEIGSSKVVGAIAEKYDSGNIQVNCLEKESLINSVRYGCVQNIEGVKNAINTILQRLSSHIDGDIRNVFVGISGRSLHSVPATQERPVNPSEIIAESVLTELRNTIKSEEVTGYETLVVEPRAYYVDNKPTSTPCGQIGNSVRLDANRIVARPQLKGNLTRVMHACGVSVRRYLVTPLAVGAEVLTAEERTIGCMLVDCGAETTTVSIYKGGSLVYLNTIPLGGRNITRDIVNGLKSVVEETAECVKLNIHEPLNAKSKHANIDGVNSEDAVNYITARTGEIVANISKQIEYAGLKADDLKTVVLLGGGAQMRGFDHVVSEQCKIQNVRNARYPDTLNITDQHINRNEYVEIFSLLARGAALLPQGDSCVSLNTYTDEGPQITQQPVEPQPKKPDTKPGKKEKKPSRWSILVRRIEDLMNDDE